MRSVRVRRLFSRALGVVYLFAFGSLRGQILGLHGQRGILPIRERLEELEARHGAAARRWAPSFLWRDASDEALVRHCQAGQLLALALMLGLAPRASSAALWSLYLSLASVSPRFLSFQWDALLLETGALAIVAAPPGLASRRSAREPAWLVRSAMRALVFRLYLESGLSKLRSGDETWRRLSACGHYYETAPLPTRLGWYAHHLPWGLQRASTAAVLAVECAGPLLIPMSRRLRQVAFVSFSALQAAIAATGNYGYFNLLSFVLGLWLLDDAALPGGSHGPRGDRTPTSGGRAVVESLLVAPAGLLAFAELRSRVLPGHAGPRWLERLEERLGPLRLVSGYGLFSVMTTRRPEIVLEGSDDGQVWKEYGFRYKPGPLDRAPRRVAPHHPRLDWQMWFAALSSPPAWFGRFVERLLEGAPEVTALLGENPFPSRPPRYVRAILYEYWMTDLATRRRTGAWWRRERIGLYLPPVARTPAGARTGSVASASRGAQTGRAGAGPPSASPSSPPAPSRRPSPADDERS